MVPVNILDQDIDAVLKRLRRHIIDMAEHSAHVGAALSCVDILAAVYFEALHSPCSPANPKDGDAFVLSKGHGAMALYAVLAEAGLIDTSWLLTYGKDDSLLAEHPLAGKVPGIEFATGSLGHGLALGAGMASGFRIQGRRGRVFVLLGDGECDEGSVWEAAGAARAQRLDNLIALIDWNNLQACGSRNEISFGNSLVGCWQGFGWEVEEIDGHDYRSLAKALIRPNEKDKPKALLCHTIKGKGVSFMEGDLEWHYRPVRDDDRERALRLLSDA